MGKQLILFIIDLVFMFYFMREEQQAFIKYPGSLGH